MIKLIIADDHEVLRHGLRRVIDSQADMEIVGEAESGDEVIELVEARVCDVLVLDISMPGPGFLPTLERIKSLKPKLPVLVLSMYAEEDWALRALKAGAAGYLSKNHKVEELTTAIRRVQRGGRYVTEALAERLAFRFSPDHEGPAHESLSDREYEVLCRLAQGKLVKEVAAELEISPRTVTTYRSRVLQKLELKSTAELIKYALEHRLTG